MDLCNYRNNRIDSSSALRFFYTVNADQLAGFLIFIPVRRFVDATLRNTNLFVRAVFHDCRTTGPYRGQISICVLVSTQDTDGRAGWCHLCCVNRCDFCRILDQVTEPNFVEEPGGLLAC